MAMKLDRYAAECERKAIEQGKITDCSNHRVILYEISRDWRALYDSTHHRDQFGWSEREKEAARIIRDTLCYLRRIGCRDIEKLLRETEL